MLALALLCLICKAAAEEQESAVERKVEQEIPVDEQEAHETTQEEEPAESKAVEVGQKTPAATDTAVAADERTSADKGVGFFFISSSDTSMSARSRSSYISSI